MIVVIQNHVDLEVDDVVKGHWRVIAFYGYPERVRRRDSWNHLRNLSVASQLPWCCMGDFNDMLYSEDKKGRVEHPEWLFRGFQTAVSDCGLQDLPLEGYPFIWERGKGTDHAVKERIDRALVTSSWLDLFSQARL